MVLVGHKRAYVIRAISLSCLLFAATTPAANGQANAQMVRPPDLGVWLSYEREAKGTHALVVTDLIADATLAQGGLRQGDRLISINGRPADREQQLVDAFLMNPLVTLVVNRDGQHLTLTLKSSLVIEGMVPLDPYYQAGFILNEHNDQSLTIERVFPATPAFYAGLKAADVITELNKQPISAPTELTKALQRGGNLSLSINRGGQPRQLILVVKPPSSRRSILADVLSAGSTAPPNMPSAAPQSPPLFAPPQSFNPTPAIPSPPPALPVLPPPGAVPSGS